MTTQRFVFLEITDPRVGSLLWRMQWILSGVEPRRPVHLTLRGPYRREVPPKVLNDLRAKLRGDVLHVGGVGRFENQNEEMVYLRVDSPNLRKVWWKPTYPIKDHGYAPHISLYRGHDAVFASSVADFLMDERLDLYCSDYRLTVHHSVPLPLVDRLREGRAAGPLGGAGQVDSSLLERLGHVVNQHRRHVLPAQSGIGRLARVGNKERGTADEKSGDVAS